MRALVVLVGLMVAVRPAAGDPAADAADHNRRGLLLYNTQDYDAAIAEWKQAYLLVPSPDTLFAIGQAQRLKGDCVAALQTYRTVLRDKIPAKQKQEVERVVGVCERQLADTTPAPEPEPVTPTPVPAPRPDRDLDPEPAPALIAPGPDAPPAQHDTRRPWYRDWLGNVLVGAGVVGVATGTTFFLLGRSAEADARDQPSYGEFAGSAETAHRDRTIAIVGFAAGGALIIGGVVRYLTRSDGGGSAEVSAWLVPDGGGVTWARGF